MKKIIFPLLLIGYTAVLILSSCGPGAKPGSILTDSLSIAQGELSFNQNCSGCHNFKRDGIGPDLSGITTVDSILWLRQFIRSPKKMTESGDEHAKNLQARYHTLMPSFENLNDQQIDHLIAFLNTQKIHKKEKPDPLAIQDPVPEKIPASGLQADLQLITQIPPTSNKEPLTRVCKMDWIQPAKSWFILDQRGFLFKLVDNKAQTWLDITKWKPQFKNEPGLATGFGSFAFHPDFAKNGIFYTTHSETPQAIKADFAIPDSIKPTLQWVLCEWKTTDSKSPVFSGTCRELLRIDMVSQLHGVQEIIFNPQSKPGDEDYGNLYIGVGDAGSVEDGYAFLTHHPDHVWGTILRINPMGRNSANGQYGIPAGNPFFKNPDPHTVREIYASGFRNPNRITWLRPGEMIATNIGQASIEAIDIVLKGHDYGWPNREGRFLMHPDGVINNIYPLPANDSIYHFTYPVAVFDHDEGKAIAGGFEYEGRTIPQFRGKYLFGDIPTGRLFYINVKDLKQGNTAPVKEWFVSLNGTRKTLRDLCGPNRVDLRFAKDEKGEMIIFTKPDGKIYRLAKLSKSNGRE
jgi:mono/diheme cytochrome c family protein